MKVCVRVSHSVQTQLYRMNDSSSKASSVCWKSSSACKANSRADGGACKGGGAAHAAGAHRYFEELNLFAQLIDERFELDDARLEQRAAAARLPSREHKRRGTDTKCSMGGTEARAPVTTNEAGPGGLRSARP